MGMAWKNGLRSIELPWIRKALLLAEIVAADGTIDRKTLELFHIVELKNRIAVNEIRIKGSHTYRALDEHMISHQTYAIIKAEARIPVAIPVDVETYLAQKAEALNQKLSDAACRLQTGRGDTRIGAKGLRVPAVRTAETGAAIAFGRPESEDNCVARIPEPDARILARARALFSVCTEPRVGQQARRIGWALIHHLTAPAVSPLTI